jgi:transcriptional regulator with XRE-family HTH domain
VELNHVVSNTGRDDPEERAGKALRQLRLAQGWSQQEVAVRMTAYGHDFHQTAIAKIEGAQRPLRVRELADFAALYGVAVQDLLYGPTRSIAQLDQEIADVEERLARAQAAAAEATAGLAAARNAVHSAEASLRSAAADVATLEGRLSALRADRPKLPRWDSAAESPGPEGGGDTRRKAQASGNIPTAARIALGAHLRGLREARGMRREDAAHAIGASSARLSRLEMGRIGIKERDVILLLTTYGVDETEYDQILELVRQSNTADKRETHSGVLPSWFNTYIGLEMAAAQVQVYEAQYIPDLLRTEEYTHAISPRTHGQISRDVAERMIELQTARKKTFFRSESPPLVHIVLDEAALRRQAGKPTVMREQLIHMMNMTELPNVEIQIAPLANSNHPADRSFRILQFGETDLPDIVYIEQLTSALYLDGVPEVARYRRVMNKLRKEALSPDETTSFMQRLLAA